MKKITSPRWIWGAATLSIALFTQCNPGTAPAEAENQKMTTADIPKPLCVVDPSWFPHSQTPEPAEGKGSPFDGANSNPMFHQWSWNKFLWLTKPDKDGNPLFLNQEKVKQVTTEMVSVTIPSGTLMALKDIQQAGSSHPILQTNPDYNGGKSETVYYSIHMNETMYDAGLDLEQKLASGKLPGSNEETFPVGSFELKVAWVPVTAIPEAKRASYYTAMAALTVAGTNKIVNTEMALIGMHVVGVVQNHPEFIWATFEHEDLAPDYDWSANSATAAADQLLFKKGTVSGIDGIVFDKATQLGKTKYQVFNLFQYGVPRDSKNGWMSTSQEEPLNFNNIENINECVQSKLDDVWKNYFYNGSIWLKMDGKTPKEQAQLINSLGNKIGAINPGGPARGSLNCSNVTMESFTQTFKTDIKDINVGNMANCFSCHSGQSFYNNANISPIYLSHTFQDYVQMKKGKTKAQTDLLKDQDEKRIQLRMSK